MAVPHGAPPAEDWGVPVTTPDIPTYGLLSRLADGKGYHTTKIPLVEREIVLPGLSLVTGDRRFSGMKKAGSLVLDRRN